LIVERGIPNMTDKADLMMDRADLKMVINDIARQYFPVHSLEQKIRELVGSHLKAFEKIEGLEDAVIAMGRFHKKHNCGNKKEDDLLSKFYDKIKSSRTEG
jgi:hypothetical protein